MKANTFSRKSSAFLVGQASRLPVLRASRPHPAPVGRRCRAALFALFAFGLALQSYAQVQQAWVAKYNNGITNGNHQALKMALDTAGDIYITGFSQNANSNLDYATLKYAPTGKQLWASRYDSTNVISATPAAMAIDTNGNTVVTGNATTVKYDSNGNQLWTAPYAGSATGVDSNGNIFVTGYSSGFDTVKLAPSGTNIWTASHVSQWGPSQSEVVSVDPAGNVYVTGSSQELPCGYEGPYKFCYQLALTIKYTSNGAQSWTAAYDPRDQPFIPVRASALDASGNLVVLMDAYKLPYTILKYSTDGGELWAVENPTAAFASQSHGLALDTSGNVLVTGENAYAYYPQTPSYGTYMFSSTGTNLWINNYANSAGTSAAYAIAIDQAGNVYITGYSPTATTSNDIVTIKYDHNGNQLWLQRYDGPAHGDDEGNAIAVDKNGNVYVAGYETVPGGGTEMVLIKYVPLNVQRQTNGGFILQTQGNPGQVFDFRASANLQDWLDLGAVAADTNGLVQFDDTNAPLFPHRFYTTTPQ